ncbi:hypothetical protein [Bacillus altitudinis]|uniref:hypothetical protein n=1 Tax=Bacillus TaxID=1386 RepID=UPI002B2AD22E|nr:hypothetical protein R0126_08555 [Bacillus stratosphericus]
MLLAKVFKRHANGKLNLKLETYDTDQQKYTDVVSNMKKEKYKQVILNSEIMLMIIEKVLKLKGMLMKIEFEDTTDSEIIEEIDHIVKKIREESVIYYEDLLKLLHWTSDNNSIDLRKLTVSLEVNKYEIYSNGIIEGENFDELFQKVIVPVLEKYL